MLLPAAFILAIIGLAIDVKYRRAGGRKSTKQDIIIFSIAALLVAAFFVFAISIGGAEGFGPAVLGHATLPIVVTLFATWELGRWRVRRKNPLPAKTAENPAAAPPPSK
jgi:drug/metabolite transporter (DMT)-like permease